MSASRERLRPREAITLAAVALVMTVCCTGPLLVVGGALGTVGGALASPRLITVGAVVLLAGTAYALQCRTRRLPRRRAGGLLSDRLRPAPPR